MGVCCTKSAVSEKWYFHGNESFLKKFFLYHFKMDFQRRNVVPDLFQCCPLTSSLFLLVKVKIFKNINFSSRITNVYSPQHSTLDLKMLNLDVLHNSSIISILFSVGLTWYIMIGALITISRWCCIHFEQIFTSIIISIRSELPQVVLWSGSYCKY